MTRVHVIDCIMGSGKTSYMLDFMKSVENIHDRYVIVVPILTEVKRWQEELTDPLLPTPMAPEYRDDQNKTADFKQLLRHRARRIIITHAMFDRVDDEVISLFRDGEYNLIIDEVPTPISEIRIHDGDLRVLITGQTLLINQETRQVTWNPKYLRESTSYKELRELCATGKVYYNEESKGLYKISPYSAYLSCKRIFILTYMFEAQIISCYFKAKGIEYDKFSIEQMSGDGEYHLIDYNPIWDKSLDLKSLICICHNEKMNAIGKSNNAFGVSWMKRHAKDYPQIKKHMFNFIRNICKAKTNDVMWTTFKNYQEAIESKGCKQGFIAVNSRATNDYSDKTVVIYLANRFFSPKMKNYFGIEDKELRFDEDAYALSEMLQFIWRSAIRTGKPINLYIPSSRMRGLLEKWIEENSVPA